MSLLFLTIGEMPEWSIGAVSKTVERYAFQGFESLSLRVGGKPGDALAAPAFVFSRRNENSLSDRLGNTKAEDGLRPDGFPPTQAPPPRQAERDDPQSG